MPCVGALVPVGLGFMSRGISKVVLSPHYHTGDLANDEYRAIMPGTESLRTSMKERRSNCSQHFQDMTSIISRYFINICGKSRLRINYIINFDWKLEQLHQIDELLCIMKEYLQVSVAGALIIWILKARTIGTGAFLPLCVPLYIYHSSQNFIVLQQDQKYYTIANWNGGARILMTNASCTHKQKEITNVSRRRIKFSNIIEEKDVYKEYDSKEKSGKQNCSSPKRATASDNFREEPIATSPERTVNKNNDQMQLNNEIDAVREVRRFGTFRRASVVQDLHMMVEEIQRVKWSLKNCGHESAVKLREKKANIVRNLYKEIPKTSRPRRRKNIEFAEDEIEEKRDWILIRNTSNTTSAMQRNYLPGEEIERERYILQNKCEKELLSAFRIRNMSVLRGKRLRNSSRCCCEVAIPMRKLKLRLSTIIEDGNEEDTIEEEGSKVLRSVAMEDLSVASTQVCWWAHAARYGQRRHAPASVQATAAATATRAAWWCRVLLSCYGWREMDD